MELDAISAAVAAAASSASAALADFSDGTVITESAGILGDRDPSINVASSSVSKAVDDATAPTDSSQDSTKAVAMPATQPAPSTSASAAPVHGPASSPPVVVPTKKAVANAPVAGGSSVSVKPNSTAPVSCCLPIDANQQHC